jgi:choline-sulfatase
MPMNRLDDIRPLRSSLAIVAFAALALVPSGCARREASAARTYPNAPVLIISIDTLRADHLPAYGYQSVQTPHIDQFRRDAILFQNAWSHVPLTLPSHVSILTGELPPDNGVRNNIGFPFDAAAHETIPSLLRKHGYSAGAAVSAYVLRAATGLGKAFDFYDDKVEVRGGESQGQSQRPGAATTAIAEQWIEKQGAHPFFFLLHLYEPHAPYDPPEPYRSRYALPYDGEIATADAIVGGFIDFLKARNLYDRAVIILLSDHGEGLSEHGEAEHGIFLYREDLHVPLLLKLPGNAQAGSTIKAPAALIDVLPTVASLTGIQAPALRGASLLELDHYPPRSLYAESLYPRIHLGWSDLRSLVDAEHHLIRAPSAELYDMTRDPAEKTNIIESERRVYAGMRRELDTYGSGMPAPARIDPEEAKRLAALGYLTSPAAAGSGPLPDPKDRIGEIAEVTEAGRLEARGDYAGAIAGFQSVLKKNPGLTDAWMLLAKTEEKAGRYEEAIASYKHGIEAAPSLLGQQALAIAALDLNLDRLDDAEKNAALALESDPAEARLILGRVALARKQPSTAEEKARAAMALDPGNRNAPILLAQALAAQHRFDEAMTTNDAVARANEGKQPVALDDFVRGDLLARTNHPVEAEAAFHREIANFPTERQAYANLAVLYFFSGRPEEARRTMDELVKRMPGSESNRFAAETFEAIGAPKLAAPFRAGAGSGERAGQGR